MRARDVDELGQHARTDEESRAREHRGLGLRAGKHRARADDSIGQLLTELRDDLVRVRDGHGDLDEPHAARRDGARRADRVLGRDGP